MRTVKIRNEEECRKFGRNLAETLEADDVIGLVGDLGTGKTSLTKSIAEGLGIREQITSPTFTIVREYHSGRIPLYHFDVYRLDSGAEMIALGGEEYFDSGGITVIEWADRVAEILPDETKMIFLEYGENEGERIFRCTF